MRRRTILSLFSSTIVTLFAAACSSAPEPAADRWLPDPSYDGFASDIPKLKRPNGTMKEYYPSKSKSLGHSGRVWLSFSVNAQGKVERISLVQTDFDDLTVGAVGMIRDLEFSVPKDWNDVGGPSRRYCMAMMFVLAGKPSPPKPQTPQTIVITHRI
jgi:TonB family protein